MLDELSALRKRFLHDGFVLLHPFVDEAAVARLEAEIADLMRFVDDPGRLFGVVRGEDGNVTVMNNIDKRSDYLYDLARQTQWLDTAAALLGKQVQPLHVEYFAKPPGVMRPTPPHQDHKFYVDHFDDEMAITFWVALDNVTESSGALRYRAPADLKLLDHAPSASPDFDFELFRDDGAAIENWRVAEVPRGGCVAHHSFVVHAAGSNLTDGPRRAVAFNYRGSPYREYLRRLGK
jgi:ectoine hydroxylase-related dioxygenase (phytanoyl-CoA dioxygenase family)